MKGQKVSIRMPVTSKVRIGSANVSLADLVQNREEAHVFLSCLQYALTSLYQSLPEGNNNYANENPKVGKVSLQRIGNNKPVFDCVPYTPSLMDLFYEPAPQQEPHITEFTKAIATVDFSKKEYYPIWGRAYNEHVHRIPQILMKDTEKVMEKLGLKEVWIVGGY